MQGIYNYIHKTNCVLWNVILQLLRVKNLLYMIWYPHDVLFCNLSLGWYFLLYALSANYPTFFGSLISRFPYMLFKHFLYGFAMVSFFSTTGITSLHVQFSFVDSVKCYFTCMNCYQCFQQMFIVCSYFNCTHTPLSIIDRS